MKALLFAATHSGRDIDEIHTMNILPHSWLVKLLAGHYSAVSSLQSV